MSKAIEVNKIEPYNKILCDFCDFIIANYKLSIISSNESRDVFFCSSCFNLFSESCKEFIESENTENENRSM